MLLSCAERLTAAGTLHVEIDSRIEIYVLSVELRRRTDEFLKLPVPLSFVFALFPVPENLTCKVFS